MSSGFCPCGSSVPFKKCCYKKKLWTILSQNGSYVLFHHHNNKMTAFPVFTTKEAALIHINERDEDLLPSRLPVRTLLKVTAPTAKKDGVSGLALNPTSLHFLFCPFKSSTPNKHKGELFLPEAQPDAQVMDEEWFAENPDLDYRVRPATDDEAAIPGGSTELVMLVAKQGRGLYFRAGLDRVKQKDLLDDFDWEELADTVKVEDIPDDLAPWVRLFRKIL